MSKKKVLDMYPLSPMQEGMLFHYIMDEEGENYFEQTCFRLKGQLHLQHFEQAWNYVIANNEVFRTVFNWEKSDKPIQIVVDQMPLTVEYHDLQTLVGEAKEQGLEQKKEDDRKTGFDLRKGPVMRVSVVQLDKDIFEVIWSHHHIILDGWCTGIIFGELFTAYQKLQRGVKLLPLKKYKYKDYIKFLLSKDKKLAQNYWRDYLAGFSEPTPLPLDWKKSQTVQEAGKKKLAFDKAFTEKLNRVAKEEKVTLNILAQTAWGVLLMKYANQNDVVFGTTVSGRPPELPGIEALVGLFINTVPVRLNMGEGLSVAALWKDTQADHFARVEFETTPLVEIKGQSDLHGKTDLFDSLFVFENYPLEETLNSFDMGFQVIGVSDFTLTNFDLTVTAGMREGLEVELRYNVKVFSEEKINQLLQHYRHIVEQMVDNPTMPVQDLQLLTTVEERYIVEEFNRTYTEYPRDKAVHQIFEEQAALYPERIAVSFGEKVMTYRELNERANQVAHLLREKGVGNETLVGMLVDRSFEMIVGIMGIMKAGGAYVPIDPEYPADRIEFMLADCGTNYLLTQAHLHDLIPTAFAGAVIDLDRNPVLAVQPVTNPVCVCTARSLAYVVYTSGSTGKPKGTLVENISISRLVLNTNYMAVQPTDRFLQLATYCFDAATCHIWGALLNGAQLVLIAKEDLLSPETLAAFFEREEITAVFITTSLFNSIVDINPAALRKIRFLMVGGERVSVHHMAKVLPYVKPGSLINAYGPTENTTYTTCYQVREIPAGADNIPIGKPIANTEVYVLDQALHPVPIGVPGELCTAGEGLARGYLNRPELTAEKFVPNPFRSGTMMYRTGDLVRYLPDGNIEFIGRIDNQVKIRGFRVEPGEIEAVLESHVEIGQAVVLPKVDANGNKYLAAYFVADRQLTVGELREYLLVTLPEYMVPGYFIQLNEMPINANGKVERKALPEPESAGFTGVEYMPPRTETEVKMAQVWAEVLSVEKVGIKDNFFELGGDSIKAIQVVARMGKAGVQAKVKDIFTHQTIEQIAFYLEGGTVEVQIDQKAVEGELLPTPVLKWFFEQNFENANHWNQAVLLEVKKELKLESLNRAFCQLIKQHDALRINLHREAGQDAQNTDQDAQEGSQAKTSQGAQEGSQASQSAQEASPARTSQVCEAGKLLHEKRYLDEPFKVDVYDLSTHPLEARTAKLAELCTDINAAMHLEKGLLMKAALINLGEMGQRLLITIHHLVVDGVSWRILLEDLMDAYKQAREGQEITLPLKSTSFKDWSEALHTYSQSAELAKELPYWQDVMSDFAPLPLDCPESGQSHQTAVVSSGLTAEETKALLTTAGTAYNTELNDLLLTALARAINEWTAREQVVIELEGHGREEIIENVDITRTVGWFTSIFPVKLNLAGTREPAEQVKAIKEQLRSIPNKGVGFGILKYLTGVQELAGEIGRETITFNYLGQVGGDVDFELFRAAQEEAGLEVDPTNHRVSRLGMVQMVVDGKLQFGINYDSNLYQKATMERLINSYHQHLLAVIDHCVSAKGTYTPSDFKLVAMPQEFLNHIDKNAVEDIYPLTPLQEGMLYYYLMDEDSENYFQQMNFTIEGQFNVQNFARAWEAVVKGNEIFRTVFHWKQLQKPVQIVQKDMPLAFLEIDISHLAGTEQQARLQEIRAAERTTQLNLSDGPTMKVTVCKLTAERREVIWSFHHILLDGWCTGIVFRELFEAYDKLTKGQPVPLVQKYKYRDYIEWLEKRHMAKASQFWQDYLKGFDTPTTLPYDHKGSGVMQKVGCQELTAGADVTARLNELAKENKVTLNILLQTAWGILLQRYNNNLDIIFGSTVSGRPAELPGVEEIVGLFINSVPIRVKSTSEMTVRQLIEQVQKESIARKDFEYSSLAEIKGQSELSTQADLFESLLVFENYPVDEVLGQMDMGFSIKEFDSFEMTNYDMTLEAMAVGKGLEIKFKYNEERFVPETIQRIIHHMENVLSAMVANPDGRITAIEILSAEEKRKLLSDFNRTFAAYPDRCIHELIEEQAVSFPDRTAVVFKDAEISYHELNERANQIAWVLQKRGVKGDTLVGMLFERSLEMVIAMLAILKAGGAYVPINPEYPEDRIAFMLLDSGVPVLLTTSNLNHLVTPEFDGEIINLDQCGEIADECTANLPNVAKPRNLAYIIYTSGTTGRPKGVMIEHENVVRLMKSTPANYDFNEHDVWTLFHSYCFDFSVWEIYGALMFGGKLVVVSKEDAIDTANFIALCKKERVTVLNQTPAAFYNFIKAELESTDHTLNQHMRYVIFGGEALNFDKLIPWVEVYSLQEIALINMYGITETTVHVTYERIKEADLYVGYRSLIGWPIYNTSVYLLDEARNPVPVGVTAEMYVGGTGVGRGYLNRPELTHEKFVDSPFVAGEKLYRSGDLARFTYDGNLEYLGRIDHQVKIRGFRIELGEIEVALLKHPEVKDAVVLDRPDSTGLQKILVAYLVSDRELPVNELREHLLQGLPDYMVPAAFIRMEQIPLTSNGKVNRNALPAPSNQVFTGTEYVAPRNKNEAIIARIWSEVLGVEKISIHDNFFALGGHSLKMIQMMSNINQTFATNYPLSMLMSHQTVAEFAAAMASDTDTEATNILMIRLGTTDKNIFCIHAGDGAVENYYDLAAYIDPEYNFYGIHARGLVDNSPLPASLAEAALDYANEIMKVQPTGPYTIAGWCVGGNIAFEVARVLQARNEEVQHLILLDVPAFDPGNPHLASPEEMARLTLLTQLSSLGLDTTTLGAVSSDELVEYFFHEDVLKNIQGYDLSKDKMLRMINIAKNTVGIIRAHQPAVLAHDLYLFKAAENDEPTISQQLWQKWVDGKVTVLNTPGDHRTMVDLPHALALAEQFNAILQHNI